MRTLRMMTALAGLASVALLGGMATAPPAAALSVGFEKDFGVKKMKLNPSGSDWWVQTSAIHHNVKAYFHGTGDKIYVFDGHKDGKSAAFRWWNYRGGKLYRQGACINKHGTPSFGLCDKNFYENSTLEGQVCMYDTPTKKFSECSFVSNRFKAHGPY